MRDVREDVDLAGLPTADERVVELAPAKHPTTVPEWLRQNLFSGPVNSAVTVVVGALVVYLGYRLLNWVFVTADWRVFRANLRVYMVGRFPEEELWRVWAAVYIVAALAGASWGVSRGRLLARKNVGAVVLVAAVAILLLAYAVDTALAWGLIAGAVATVAVAGLGGRVAGDRFRRVLIGAWILAFPAVIVLLRAFDGVPPEQWGGFVLNMLVAVVGIFVSFPIGILLALGRRSTLPVISNFCVGFIEIIRGAPLIGWLVFGEYVLPLLLPPQMATTPSIVRAMIMFTVFSTAYVAEIVRGGLQGVHSGQYEAARAVGLSTTRMMALVILPQALRNTIPAMIGHFISLFKDTSLLAAVAFTDLLRAARRASAALDFIGDQKEALLPAALIFWIVAFSMSRWSQRLETRLGVGIR